MGETARRLVGFVSLGTLVGVVLWIALAAADGQSFLVPAGRESFPDWLAGPLRGSGLSLTYKEVGYLLLLAFTGYLGALYSARTLSKLVIFVVIGLVYLICLLAPPLFSADVFSYLDLARIDLLHGFDIYGGTSAPVPLDQAQQFMNWQPRGSVYGPLFILFTYLAVPFGLAGGLWFFKAVTVIAAFCSALLIWQIASIRGQNPQRATILLALNPLTIIFAVGGTHNDLLLMLITVAAIWAYAREHAFAAGVLSTVAGAFKLSAALPLPFMVLADVRRAPKLIWGVLSALVLTLMLSLLVFGTTFLDFLPQLLGLQERVAFASVSNQLGLLFGLSGSTSEIELVAKLALLIVAVVTLIKTAKGADWIVMTGYLYVAVLLTTTWILPWYLIWLLPFAAVGKSRALQALTVALTLYLIATRIPFLLGG